MIWFYSQSRETVDKFNALHSNILFSKFLTTFSLGHMKDHCLEAKKRLNGSSHKSPMNEKCFLLQVCHQAMWLVYIPTLLSLHECQQHIGTFSHTRQYNCPSFFPPYFCYKCCLYARSHMCWERWRHEFSTKIESPSS